MHSVQYTQHDRDALHNIALYKFFILISYFILKVSWVLGRMISGRRATAGVKGKGSV